MPSSLTPEIIFPELSTPHATAKRVEATLHDIISAL